MEEHRPPTNILHPTLSWTILPSCFQLLFILFTFASNSQSSVNFGPPPFQFPQKLQVSACFVIPFDDFLNVCPIHFQYHFPISFPSGNSSVLLHIRRLLMISSQQTLSISCRQLFRNTCTIWMMVVVVLQVSSPYSIEDSDFDVG
ncbi:unnamed protein product [Schistosoma guineensis]|nr:unnamed protein product [Schistosoma guineensis]